MQNQNAQSTLEIYKQNIIKGWQKRVDERILEPQNYEVLVKLIANAQSQVEADAINTLGTYYKRTGFHFDVRLEKDDKTKIYYLKRLENLSFKATHADENAENSQENSQNLSQNSQNALSFRHSEGANASEESTPHKESVNLKMDSSHSANAQNDGFGAGSMESLGDKSARNDEKSDTAKTPKNSQNFTKGGVQNAKNSHSPLTHTLIIGDNYPALQNLLISYQGKIKVIYIDPPYGKGDMGEFADTNYDNAITRDNLLSMLKPRLELAKMLLKDDGVIFCSIDDRNQAYLKCLFDEVFGERNCCGNNIIWLKGNAQNDADAIQRNHEYILCYAKDIETDPINKIAQKVNEKVFKDEKTGKFYYEGAGLTTGGAGGTLNARPNLGCTIYYNPKTQDMIIKDDYDKELAKTSNDESKIYKNDNDLLKKGYEIIRPPKKGSNLGCWTWGLDKFNASKDSILIRKNTNGYSIFKKQWLDSKSVKQDSDGEFYAMVEKENPPKSFIDFASSGLGSKELKSIMGAKVFNNPKNTKLLKHLLQISTTANSGDNERERERERERGNSAAPNSAHSVNLNANSQENSQNTINSSLRESQGDSKQSTATNSPVSMDCFGVCTPRNDEVGVNSSDDGDIVLDFFAGSGTTAHAVMELNRIDGGKRRCILVTNNQVEISKGKYESGILENGELDERGIALKVTAKRLKRIMTGACYDENTDFEWIKKNKPYGDGLAVYEIATIDKIALDGEKNIFTAIDERNYALDKEIYDLDENGRFKFAHDKALWIADKFAPTLTQLETNAEYLARHGKSQESQNQNSQNKPQANPQDSKGSEQ